MNADPSSAPARATLVRHCGFLLRLCLVLVGVVGFSADAHAYAWMLKNGYAKCSSCHTDPSGGETLTHMGRVQSQLLLSHVWGDEPELTNNAKFLHGIDEPNALRLGGSFRYMNIYSLATDTSEASFATFPMQLDVYGTADFGDIQAGGSIGAGSVAQGSPHVRAAQVLSGNDGILPISRSHWVGLELGDHGLLRAGRLNLPFGVRIPEHVAWVRDATKTDRESDQQHGLALAHWGDAWRGEWMLVAGNYQVSPDEFRERGYAGYFEYLFSSRLALGVSSMILQSRSGPHFNPVGAKVLRHAHGVTARYSPMTELAVLAEVDVLKTSGSGIGYVAFLQGDYEVLQGLHGMLTIEALDNGAPDPADDAAAAGAAAMPMTAATETAPGAGEPTFGVWVGANWFFWTHFDWRIEAVLRQEAATAIQSQLHYYF